MLTTAVFVLQHCRHQAGFSAAQKQQGDGHEVRLNVDQAQQEGVLSEEGHVWIMLPPVRPALVNRHCMGYMGQFSLHGGVQIDKEG